MGELFTLDNSVMQSPFDLSYFLRALEQSDMVEAGNIDLAKRPQVKLDDGSMATVRSLGVNIDGLETLIPTISDDGKLLSDDDAVALFKKTGQHLGKFKTVESASSYAKRLSKQQEQMYVGTEGKE
jgi:hypothetical protein